MTIKKKRKLFIDDGRPHGTVILNWHGTPEKEFTYIAEAFRVLAQEAVAKLRRNKRFGLHGLPIEDFRAYPIIFLYRHALELYMKAIVLVGYPCDPSTRAPSAHAAIAVSSSGSPSASRPGAFVVVVGAPSSTTPFWMS